MRQQLLFNAMRKGPVMSNLIRLHEDLARVVLVDRDLGDILTEITSLARRAAPPFDAASITLIRGDKAFTAGYDGQMALDADEMQYERGYGPCIDAGVSGTMLRVDDMRSETRWPDYAATVVARGVLASLSVPLPLQTDVVGALNCYARTTAAFAGDDQAATELADHIAVAVANAVAYADTAEYAGQMREAMAGRAVIEQAKGVIMAQNRCGADEAFDVLRRASMGRNVKLRTVAEALVQSVSTPATPGR